jgi:hypothetical protein
MVGSSIIAKERRTVVHAAVRGAEATLWRLAMRIDGDFDGGAVQVIRAVAPDAIDLAIPHDTNAPNLRQWFAFRARELGGAPAHITLVNAGEATYPDALYPFTGSWAGA